MKILLPLLMLTMSLMFVVAQDENEQPRAISRGLLKRGPLKTKQTTTTTTPAPLDDAEYEDEGDYPIEGEAQEASTEAPTSTTEGKKLVGSGVRPFRSNADLLESLKRRRAQAAEAKLNGPTSSTTTAAPAQDSLDPTKVNYTTKSKKRFNNAPVTREVANEDAPAAPKPSRGRFGRPATRSVQEPEEETNDAASPARPSRTFRRGGN